MSGKHNSPSNRRMSAGSKYCLNSKGIRKKKLDSQCRLNSKKSSSSSASRRYTLRLGKRLGIK